MPFVTLGEEITYITNNGEEKEATVCLLVMKFGCVAVTESEWSEGDDPPDDQYFITMESIRGVTLSDDGDTWKMNANA